MLKKEGFRSLILAFIMVGFAISIACLCFFPGTINLDSQWQLQQAEQNAYNDAHPPIMSYIWHLLNSVFTLTKGSANLFLFVVVLYSIAITLIAFAEYTSKINRILFFLMTLLFPPVVLILGFVIKDSLMAVTLLLAYAIMLHAEQKQSTLLLFLSLIPLFIAFSARYNSMFAVMPLTIWFAVIFCRIFKIKLKWLAYGLLCVGISSILFIGLFVTRDRLVHNVLQATPSNAAQFLLVYDLVGVSVRSKENCLPAFYNTPDRPITDEFLRHVYRPFTNYYVFWPEKEGDRTFSVTWNSEQEKELLKSWIIALKKHPIAMFNHKIESYFSALGLTYKYGQLRANELDSPIGIPWSKVIPSRTMDAWLYLLILTILFLSPIRLDNGKKVLFWSGYLYGLSWILCTSNNEQRYFFWVIMSCTVLVSGLLVDRIPTFATQNFIFRSRFHTMTINQKSNQ